MANDLIEYINRRKGTKRGYHGALLSEPCHTGYC
jgi:hypothetical protein